MAAIVIRENAKATCLTGIVGVRAKACEMVQRGMAYAAATVLICAVGAALLQLVAEILSFPAPIAATAITLIAAALLNSLRRNTRAQARHRYGPGEPARPGGEERPIQAPGRKSYRQRRSLAGSHSS